MNWLSKPTCRSFSIGALIIWIGILIAGCGGGANSGSTAPPSQAVVITTQPADSYIPIGRAAIFSVTATGMTPLSYQWSKNGVAIANATASTYSTPDVSLADSGSTFSVTVRNATSSATSNLAKLTTGARAPLRGDMRFLVAQQVSANGLGQNGGLSTFLLVGEAASYTNVIGSPLGMGSSGLCVSGSEYDCAWPFSVSYLPTGVTGLSASYRGKDLPSFDSDLQSVIAPNVVLTSLDFEPAENSYAMSWVQTASTGGFDFRREIVAPAEVQSAVEQDGSASRIVTAVSFEASGQANLISYGWQGDTATVYDTQAVLSGPQDVATAATNLANSGYIITAFGGNDTVGYLLIGARVHGDTLPRSLGITTQNYSGQPPNPDAAYFTTVAHLFYDGVDMMIDEQ